MTGPDQPFDPGLQLERTLLAWRRTALAVAVVSAAMIRLSTPVIGWVAVLVGSCGITLTVTAYVAMGVRYRRVHLSLTQNAGYSSNGWPATTLAAAVTLLGLAALAYVLATLANVLQYPAEM